MVLLLALIACTPDIHDDYEAEKARALAVETSLPSSWEPDLRISLPAATIQQAARVSLETALARASSIPLKLPLGVTGALHPELAVKKLTLSPSTECAACFAVEAALDGRGSWELGPAHGSAPLEVGFNGTFAVQVEEGTKVTGALRSIGKVTVDLGGLGDLKLDARGEVQRWVKDTLGERIPAVRLTELDLSGVPVRAVRLATTPDALHVELLSDVPGTRPLGAPTAVGADARVTVHQSTLTGLARRAAWRAGVQDMDIAADPRSLTVSGDRFTLGLRVWRLAGRGWWRDYTVSGKISAQNARLKLVAESATEGDKSPGAELADPLAALFEGKILEALVDNVQSTLPGRKAENLGLVQLVLTLARASGEGEALVLEGPVKVNAPKSGR